MQIIFLLHDIHFGGGGERVTVNMANQLVGKGYLVTIVSLSRSKPSNIFSIDNRVAMEYLNFNFENGFNIPQKIASVYEVRKYFRQYAYDDKTVILGIGTYPSFLLTMLTKNKKLKTIGCQHSTYAAVKYVWTLLRKIFFHRLDAFVSLSEQDLPKLKKINKNSYVIPNSVSLFPEKPALLENKIILSIGRMDYNKGYDLLLDVFEKLTLLHPDWSLRIVGDGPLKKKIISRVETSDLKDRVEIFPPTNQIINHYLQASIYLMTSRTEGLGMVLLEAQACGLPIVSFDCETGPSDIVIDNKNGFLVECFNIERIVQRIALLCSDYDLRVKFGKRAIEDVRKFRPEAINSKWESLFEELFKQ